MNKQIESKMDKIVSLCKRRGFIYQGSEIYGGLAGTFDYGPLGVTLKNNIKNLWWKMFVSDREDMYGVDAAILMNQNVWKASGHVGGFADPLVECTNCETRYRVDQLPSFSEVDYSVVQKEIARKFRQPIVDLLGNLTKSYKTVGEKIGKARGLLDFIKDGSLSDEENQIFNDVFDKHLKEIDKLMGDNKETRVIIENMIQTLEDSKRYKGYITQEYLNRFLECPTCDVSAKWGTPSQFNMMFKTNIGVSEDESSISYLRPETAGGMFVNFKNVIDSFHPKMPFGLGQIGKAFRNEIAPRDFIFRLRELEQMEIEYFIHEGDWQEEFEIWRKHMGEWIDAIGLNRSHVHEIEVSDGDRAFYSKRTIDFEFDFPFGQSELYGLAYRTDFDLSSHSKGSSVPLEYYDEETKERFVPHVIEPSFGLDRTILAVLSEAYVEDEMNGELRAYLKFHPRIAPVKVAVFPLLKNKPELVEKARGVYDTLKKEIGGVVFDDNGNIGKRYRRQDEIGTPYCVTIDFDTLSDDTVTLRDRDTGKQDRMKISELSLFVREAIK